MTTLIPEALDAACEAAFAMQRREYAHVWDKMDDRARKQWIDMCEAAILAYQENAASQGWKMCPLAVTKEMALAGEEAADEACDQGRDTDGTYDIFHTDVAAFKAWQAMWNAAPTPPKGK